ncbi:MAG TPA: hypothetical protein DCQ06_02060 [Myxococcales bacterium]|nr:hypothetical protein [Myxococcales bacterium]HAN30358.1 hypothetical protein [Myxococcales bacterium]
MSVRWLLVLVCMATSVGCSAEQELEVPEQLVVETWNLGIAYNFVPYAIARRDQTIAAAAASDADILCIQEVWTKEDVAALQKAAGQAGFIETWFVPTPEDVTDLPIACTVGDTQDLQPCAEDKCLKSTELANCVQSQCGSELGAVSDSCLTCLASNLHLGLEEILLNCAKGGAKFTYGGDTGLLLLSRVPLRNKKLTILDSTLVRRATLQASVTAPTGDSMRVTCTHLTAALSSVPYSGPKASWKEEQKGQVERLVELTQGSGPELILGDLNMSPAAGSLVKAEFPDHYDLLVAAGFTSPYLAGSAPKCTFCIDNTLVGQGVDTGGEGVAIDHALLKGYGGSVTDAQRSYDQLVTLDGVDDKQHLSDHFGVRMTLR